ncbi:MAG: YCF48-related protein [Pseudomonadota bacterium]
MQYTAYAATMQSVWFSRDEGESWSRLLTPTGGFYNEARSWSVCTHPDRPGELLTGTDQGLYRFTEDAGRFDYIPSPMDPLHIQQVKQHPKDPDFIVCGTRPGEIFVSENGGESWRRCNLNTATECWFINTTRVTSVAFDPSHDNSIWITVEIDGVFRSDDRGHTWTRLVDGLHDNDTHDLAFRDYGNGKRTILCSTEESMHRSTDEGQSWQQILIPEAPWMYFRSIKQPFENSDTIIASVGDKPSGEEGLLLISDDFGETWSRCGMSDPANSTIWSIGTNAADPNLLFAVTIFGQIFKSTDGGRNWQKMKRELGEIRMVTWAPVGGDA